MHHEYLSIKAILFAYDLKCSQQLSGNVVVYVYL